jgi:hypothetical protein
VGGSNDGKLRSVLSRVSKETRGTHGHRQGWVARSGPPATLCDFPKARREDHAPLGDGDIKRMLRRIFGFYFAILSVVSLLVPFQAALQILRGEPPSGPQVHSALRNLELLTLAAVFGVAGWKTLRRGRRAAASTNRWPLVASLLNLLIAIGVPSAHYAVQGASALLSAERAFIFPQVMGLTASVYFLKSAASHRKSGGGWPRSQGSEIER